MRLFRRLRGGLERLRHLPPPAQLASLYLGLIVLGTILLILPISNTGKVTSLDAAFTSVSAVTVTGLAVVDTGSDYTIVGQAIIACLIQLGGLGLMTFAVLVLTSLGIPVGFSHRVILREDLNQPSLGNLTSLVEQIFKIAVVVELGGALLLIIDFVPRLGVAEGIWSAIFTSISAFNNAGFALYPDSLSGWVGDPLLNIVVPLMFIVSGLGFLVVGEIVNKRSWRKLSLHSKLMLSGTAILILWGTLTFGLLEWNNPGTLGGLESTSDRLWAAWFQGVTPRTAGFNTVDITQMREETSLLTIALMLIGGGSTSTAGGIKVTTFAVLIIATLAFFRRRQDLTIFGRSIRGEELLKVLALTIVSMLLVMVSLFLLLIFEDASFLELAFEVSSAFGTVGLSLGATGDLTWAGKIVIMVVMFLGRVGPLTLGFFLATRTVPQVRYPEGRVFLG
ncbi:TrkH family potassium uptake protein [Tropicimonas sp. IMCC34011]|uniref:TrkH family potassium uptake protein n=1 Tax=Tropicimonas sp. IMCC34011 TaxID=2248759 RepID=UPI000E27D874|nr:TrkH family potassium uptake protein [Tropicimonas sp. IMCC34011]